MEQLDNLILLKNSFRRRGIIQRISIYSVLFLTISLWYFFGLPENLIFLFYCCLGCYLILLIFFILEYRNHSGEYSSMKIDKNSLYLPKWLNPKKYKIIPLHNIYSIQLRGKDDLGFIIIGIKNGLNLTMINSQFKEEKDISKFIECIRQAIIYYEGSVESINLREKIGRSYVNIVPVSTILIGALLVICFLLQQILPEDSDVVFELLRLGGLNKNLLISGEYFRLTSSLFIHLNYFHLLINIFTLIVFGNLVEHLIGKINLLIIFLISGVFASLLSVLFEQYVVTIGASGGIYGIIGTYILIRIKYRNVLPTIIKAQQGWFLFLIFSISILFPLLSSNTDFVCHLGGLITGFFYAMVLSHLKKNKIDNFCVNNKFANIILVTIITFYMVNFTYSIKYIYNHHDSVAYQKYIIGLFLNETKKISSDQEVNYISYYIANQTQPSIDDLHKVRKKMESIVEKRPENHQCMDTLALIYFKLGLIDKAIITEKQAVFIKPKNEYLIQLEKFENQKITQ
jgi:membrane associated rhomboid family serine protease